MLVGFIRFFFIVSCAVGGFQAGQFIAVTFPRQPSTYLLTARILSLAISLGLGYVFGGIVGRKIDSVIDSLLENIHKYSIINLFTGIIGLILGLIVAALISLPVSRIEFIGNYLSILIFIITGYIGLTIAIKKSSDLGQLSLHIPTTPIEDEGSSTRPKILDTSIIIDGRIIDIAKTGFLEGNLIVPRFVLNEIHNLADSEDHLKREKARRGLDVLQELQRDLKIGVEINDTDYLTINGVDAKLIQFAKDIKAAILTNDFNLNKVAQLEGIIVLNINELSNAVKPILIPGEFLNLKIIKEGKEHNQGIAYLDDGTMIVVEDAGDKINKILDVVVTSTLQTNAGRMIFAKINQPTHHSNNIEQNFKHIGLR